MQLTAAAQGPGRTAACPQQQKLCTSLCPHHSCQSLIPTDTAASAVASQGQQNRSTAGHWMPSALCLRCKETHQWGCRSAPLTPCLPRTTRARSGHPACSRSTQAHSQAETTATHVTVHPCVTQSCADDALAANLSRLQQAPCVHDTTAENEMRQCPAQIRRWVLQLLLLLQLVAPACVQE